MKTIRAFVQIINLQTVVIIALSLLATFICLQIDFAFELPTGLIGLAIVFPIVFSINAAYRRREEALRYYASLKAHGIALFLAHRDWVPASDDRHAERMRRLLIQLFQAVGLYFRTAEHSPVGFQPVYDVFSQISRSMEQVRTAGMSGSEVSRSNQYLRAMMIEFERMRNIAHYRTPTTLRAYSQVFLNAFPILFAPYFASLSQVYFVGSGFLVAILYGLILVSLDNIQEDLENPYDSIGRDDINLDESVDYDRLLGRLKDDTILSE